jgi:hypothetical protein
MFTLSNVHVPWNFAAPGISPAAAMSRTVRASSPKRETTPSILQRLRPVILDIG